MREFKFRAWHLQHRRMLEVVQMDFHRGQISGRWTDGDGDETGALSLDSCDLLQFTGLQDMKGREIYEGDYVDDTHGRIGIFQSFLLVRWDDEEACFSLYDPINRRVRWNVHLMEVIGNVYETRCGR